MNNPIPLSTDSQQMNDAISMLEGISLTNPEAVEKFLLNDDELCDVSPCGIGFVITPSKALTDFIAQNKNSLQ